MSDVAIESITIPAELLPSDGRFGCGPSKVRPEQLQSLVDIGASVMGTSHRQAPVKNVVDSIRAGLADLFSLPEGYKVVLSNGCLLYTSPSPRDKRQSRMPSSA